MTIQDFMLIMLLMLSSQLLFSQELAVKLTIESEDVIRNKNSNYKEFVFELTGVNARTVVDNLRARIDQEEKVLESNFSMTEPNHFDGYIKLEYGLGLIEMTAMMMGAGIEHIVRDGITMSVRDLRAEVRARQAKRI